MVRNDILRVCFFFCSIEWNSESLLLFLFHGVVFRVVFSSMEGFSTEFLKFTSLFVPWNGNPRVSCSAEQPEFRRKNHLCRQFRLPRNYFFGNSQPYVHTVSRISSAVGVPADASSIVGDPTVADIPALAGVPFAELGNQ
jgi:hypothetical protein